MRFGASCNCICCNAVASVAMYFDNTLLGDTWMQRVIQVDLNVEGNADTSGMSSPLTCTTAQQTHIHFAAQASATVVLCL